MTEAKKPKKTPSYTAAADELDEILEEIETGAVDIDVLSEKVERAAFLIAVCREKLAGTEMRVTKILEELEAEPTEEPTEGEPPF